MLIDEIPSPNFALNQNGNVTIFIPELHGTPQNPSLSCLDETTLLFQRSEKEGCRLTNIPNEPMSSLSKVEKCLVVELDLKTVGELYEFDSPDFETAFRKVYEINVDNSSFKKKGN